LERIILASTNPGDKVLDPFMGSGTTAIATLRHHRIFIGIEMEKEYIELAIKRIKDELGKIHTSLFAFSRR
jgi:DNA modification methylase